MITLENPTPTDQKLIPLEKSIWLSQKEKSSLLEITAKERIRMIHVMVLELFRIVELLALSRSGYFHLTK
jgi:NADH:ubiquinone oxidoreductase subunit D